MDENNDGVRIISTPGGVCDRCKAKVDQRYRVTRYHGDEATEQVLCQSCAETVNRPAALRPAAAAAESDVGADRKPAPKKSNRKPWIVLLIAIPVLVALAVGVRFLFFANKKGSGKTDGTTAAVEQRPNEPAPIEEEEKLSGLIAVAKARGSSAIVVHCIDPETGDVSETREFYADGVAFDVFSKTGVVRTQLFSSDYGLLAGTFADGNGNVFPVWVDDEGNVVNAYEAFVRGSEREEERNPNLQEDPAVICKAYGFDEEDRFCFSVTKGDDTRYYLLLCDGPLSDVLYRDVSELKDVTETIVNSQNEPEIAVSNLLMIGDPDVFIVTDGKPAEETDDSYVIDQATYEKITGWIGDGEYFYNDTDTVNAATVHCVMKGSLTSGRNRFATNGEAFDAVVSPDRSFAAYCLKRDDGSVSLYLSDIEGRNQKEVEPKLTFASVPDQIPIDAETGRLCDWL